MVSAHAASIGDTLLGVPLNCSAGLNADAVTLLQEAGLWQFASCLTARTLAGTERAQALSRWAGHVLHHEGCLWRCVGLLTAAGCLSAAVQASVFGGGGSKQQRRRHRCRHPDRHACGCVLLPRLLLQVLRSGGLPDCAQAYVLACKQAGLLVACSRLAPAPQQQSLEDPAAAGSASSGCEPQQPGVAAVTDAGGGELFDLLGQRTRMMPYTSSRAASGGLPGSSSEPTGPDELALVQTEYTTFLSTLLSSL